MRPSKQCVVALMALAIASLASQSSAAPATLAAKPLDAHAIHAALAQNTLSIATATGHTAHYYLATPDILRGTYDGTKIKGHWSIRNNMLCLRVPQKRDSGCWNVLRYQDGRLQLFNVTGTPAGDLGVSEGNPQNF